MDPKKKIARLRNALKKAAKATPEWEKAWRKLRRWNRDFEGSKPFDDGLAFVHHLGKKGFKNIGEGAFSIVMAKENSDKVIKISKVADQPDGWLDYVKWAAEKGYAGTFAPKVYSFKRVKGRQLDFNIASMERLNYKCDYSKGAILLPRLFDYHIHYGNDVAAKMADFVMPGVSAFMTDLRASFPEARWDLHGGNFIPRNDNFMVLTDPIAGLKSTAPKRWKASSVQANAA